MPPNIPPVPSAMHLHQVVTQERGSLICRDVSCMCAATMKKLDCQWPGSKVFNFLSDPTPSKSTEIDWHSTDIIGKWCVVKYDKDIYPGIVIASDDTDIQVKCMHSGGQNKFGPFMTMYSASSQPHYQSLVAMWQSKEIYGWILQSKFCVCVCVFCTCVCAYMC